MMNNNDDDSDSDNEDDEEDDDEESHLTDVADGISAPKKLRNKQEVGSHHGMQRTLVGHGQSGLDSNALQHTSITIRTKDKHLALR
jgi:hypothetical protein